MPSHRLTTFHPSAPRTTLELIAGKRFRNVKSDFAELTNSVRSSSRDANSTPDTVAVSQFQDGQWGHLDGSVSPDNVTLVRSQRQETGYSPFKRHTVYQFSKQENGTQSYLLNQDYFSFNDPCSDYSRHESFTVQQDGSLQYSDESSANWSSETLKKHRETSFHPQQLKSRKQVDAHVLMTKVKTEVSQALNTVRSADNGDKDLDPAPGITFVDDFQDSRDTTWSGVVSPEGGIAASGLDIQSGGKVRVYRQDGDTFSVETGVMWTGRSGHSFEQRSLTQFTTNSDGTVTLTQAGRSPF